MDASIYDALQKEGLVLCFLLFEDTSIELYDVILQNVCLNCFI